jgi:hypothetical protein
MLTVPRDSSPPSAESAPPVRCAIYARVSVADADRREFTSIHAQIEACEHFIASRCGLGWVLAEPAYIDEGMGASGIRIAPAS